MSYLKMGISRVVSLYKNPRQYIYFVSQSMRGAIVYNSLNHFYENQYYKLYSRLSGKLGIDVLYSLDISQYSQNRHCL